MIAKLRHRLQNPFFVMACVVAMFFVKASIKIWVGHEVNSPMIMGDGFHNVADIVESALVIIVLIIATRPRSQEYSLGRGNAEFFATLAVAIMLGAVAFEFVVRSLGGLALHFRWLASAFSACGWLLSHVWVVGPWLVERLTVTDIAPTEINGPMFPWVFGITLLSLVLSRLASHAQIKVGRNTGHAIVEAAGQETRSDSRVEMVTLAGIVCEKMFPGLPWLEYLFALVVSLVVARTAVDLFMESIRALCAKSIGLEIDLHLREMCLKLHGVADVSSLGTFRVGPLAVVKVTLHTMLDAAVPALTDAVEAQLRSYVITQGFLECQVDVTVKRPDACRHRIAYAVCCAHGDFETIAATLAGATHIVVADIEYGEIDRATWYPVPEDAHAFLVHKHVRTLYVFDVDSQQASWNCPDVELKGSTSYIPAAVGLVKPAR
jgi:divalent metal cation (Fe/Co/Zn/Cd) transporter